MESPLKKLKRLVGESKAIRNGALTKALGKKVSNSHRHGYLISGSEERKLSEKELKEMRDMHGDTRVE